MSVPLTGISMATLTFTARDVVEQAAIQYAVAGVIHDEVHVVGIHVYQYTVDIEFRCGDDLTIYAIGLELPQDDDDFFPPRDSAAAWVEETISLLSEEFATGVLTRAPSKKIGNRIYLDL